MPVTFKEKKKEKTTATTALWPLYTVSPKTSTFCFLKIILSKINRFYRFLACEILKKFDM